ncbi:hypothetical protein GF327_02305, partial [Candidatus Woesearchaeota archaeon]|nr:hypothetical protein [Candidatus Woesearchaeota archaeon]
MFKKTIIMVFFVIITSALAQQTPDCEGILGQGYAYEATENCGDFPEGFENRYMCKQDMHSY